MNEVVARALASYDNPTSWIDEYWWAEMNIDKRREYEDKAEQVIEALIETRLLLQHRFKSHKVKTVYKPIEQINVWARMRENYVSTIHDDWER